MSSSGNDELHRADDGQIRDSGLPVEKQNMIDQLQEISGSNETAVCRRALEASSWDLDVAVRDVLNLADTDRSRVPNRAVQSNNSYGVLSWLLNFARWPINRLLSTVANMLNLCWSIIQGGTPTDPLEDVNSFIEDYSSSYSASHPVFFRGSYRQAISAAKEQLRFLLVYLHCSSHQETSHFCRRTLSDAEVIEFCDENLLVWACSVDRPEGYRVSQALRENGYPFVGLIVLRENKMTVVGRLEGYYEPEVLLRCLKEMMSNNEASLVAARVDRNERHLTQEIRQEQDAAYLESLRVDQQKERDRSEALARQQQQQLECQQREQLRQQQLEQVARQRIELASEIPDEPRPEQADTVRFSIKLPNGTRIERRFLTSHSLKVLYYVVFCHPESPDRFEITQNFPRRVLPCEPSRQYEPPSLAAVGLGKSEVLYVRNLDA